MATTVVPPEFGALVTGSDYVVHAVVRKVSAEKRPSARGVKIFTRVELETIEVVTGAPPATIVLELLGGAVGGEELIVDGMPRFAVGDEDILFVSGNGRAACPLYGMMHGRYAIERDPVAKRAYVVRSDGAPLRDTAQVSTALAEQRMSAAAGQVAAATALSPTEFIRRIRAANTDDNRNRTR